MLSNSTEMEGTAKQGGMALTESRPATAGGTAGPGLCRHEHGTCKLFGFTTSRRSFHATG